MKMAENEDVSSLIPESSKPVTENWDLSSYSNVVQQNGFHLEENKDDVLTELRQEMKILAKKVDFLYGEVMAFRFEELQMEIRSWKTSVEILSARLTALEGSGGEIGNAASSVEVPRSEPDGPTYTSSAFFSPTANYLSTGRVASAGFESRPNGYNSGSSGFSSIESSPYNFPPDYDFFKSNGDHFADWNKEAGNESNSNVLSNLIQQLNVGSRDMQLSGNSQVSSMYEYGNGLRRSNSNRSRRSRRSSLPDAVRNNAWNFGGNNNNGRSGSFIGLPSDMFNEAEIEDDAFSSGPRMGRSGAVKELEITCRFGESGQGRGQMQAPHGFCFGHNQEIIIADTNNHRIHFFDRNGFYLHEIGKAGKRDGQLWFPRKVAFIHSTQSIVICDRGHERSRIQVFSRTGIHKLTIPVDYVAIVAGMTVYQNHIVIVDSVNPACFILESERVADPVYFFNCGKYMKEPSDVVIFDNHFYICDFKGHCVSVFDGRGKFVRQIGDNSYINFPNGIDVTPQGHILVGDSHGNRFHVAAYTTDGRFLAEYECPHMKVSRCCGLRLTAQGNIVTIAKNNNFVLVLAPVNITNDPGFISEDVEQTQETRF